MLGEGYLQSRFRDLCPRSGLAALKFVRDLMLNHCNEQDRKDHGLGVNLACVCLLSYGRWRRVDSFVYSSKLHGSARPISMKSDIIRKWARHDALHASENSS